MSNKDYFEESRSANLAYWGLGQMLRGAGWAAAVLVAIGFLLYGTWAIGQLLPAESKQAPSPYGAIEAPAAVLRIA
jgi:hypothetical protein